MKRLAIALLAAMLAGPAPAEVKDMDMKMEKKSAQGTVHKASGVVKKVDAEKGKLTIAHEPVKSLGWPAMNMAFAVRDKKLLDKVAVNKKIEFEFVKQGKDYVVTSVK